MRKVTFITLVFLSWTGIANTQVVSFPENDAIWQEEYITIAGPFSRFFALCGDTLINSKNYNQLVQLQLDVNGEVTGKTYFAAVRTEGPKVWVVPQAATAEVLLYDYSLQAGQQVQLLNLTTGEQVSRTVDSVKVENIASANRRVIYFKPEASESGEFWIQGIGSNYGVLWRAHVPFPDFAFALLCFQHADKYVNLTTTECLLPQLPEECDQVNADHAPVPASVTLKLTAFPNPGGQEMNFRVSVNSQLEKYNLKIYAANGKLMQTIEQVLPTTKLSPEPSMKPGFYIAVLELKQSGRVVAHCTFVTGE